MWCNDQQVFFFYIYTVLFPVSTLSQMMLVLYPPGFFYFFLNYHLFIYLFLAVLGLRFCARAFSSCGKRGLLFIAVWSTGIFKHLHCSGLLVRDWDVVTRRQSQPLPSWRPKMIINFSSSKWEPSGLRVRIVGDDRPSDSLPNWVFPSKVSMRRGEFLSSLNNK